MQEMSPRNKQRLLWPFLARLSLIVLWKDHTIFILTSSSVLWRNVIESQICN